jgi:RNA polymerase sigma-70 factor (ECF subfamily)
VEPPPEQLASSNVRQLIDQAQGGSAEALGRLLEDCRPYLLSVANQELRAELQGKLAPSDLVQETFLRAHGNIDQFNGQTEEELLSWLRRILLNTLANATRRYQGTEKRQSSREVALDANDSGEAFRNAIPAPGSSPSSEFSDRERDEALQRALRQLPELQRSVIQLRNWELLPFEEIGRRIGRSPEAARKLWARSLEYLRSILEGADDSQQ